MGKLLKGKNIFTDKATLVVRKMLSNPYRKWVIRDFTGSSGVSLGMAQGVIAAMAEKGYIERAKRGPDSYAFLSNIDELIGDWLAEYRFELNETDIYYSPDKNILSKLKTCLNDKQYALTLHSGANLITSFVVTDNVYLYFQSPDREKDILEMRQQLNLKELVSGGNIYIIRPYYKNSVFYGMEKIKGYKVVSNLQLYLDLYGFNPRGREHAEYLKNRIKEKTGSLYGF